MKKATLAAGCFWCTEAIFKRVDGVEDVKPGYTGGHTENPTYDDVCRGDTGHAECVQLRYDPDTVTYERILEIYWETHDPFRGDGQGPDSGSQYRPVIFYHDEEQKRIVEKTKKAIEKDASKPVSTEIEKLGRFYVAEEKHHDFYEKNPWHPYCVVNISPKIKKYFDE